MVLSCDEACARSDLYAAEQHAIFRAEAAPPDDNTVGEKDRGDAEDQFGPFGQPRRQPAYEYRGSGTKSVNATDTSLSVAPAQNLLCAMLHHH